MRAHVKRNKSEPPIVVVTLDENGGVVAIGSMKKGGCGNDKG